jgi:hypothetical protein
MGNLDWMLIGAVLMMLAENLELYTRGLVAPTQMWGSVLIALIGFLVYSPFIVKAIRKSIREEDNHYLESDDKEES